MDDTFWLSIEFLGSIKLYTYTSSVADEGRVTCLLTFIWHGSCKVTFSANPDNFDSQDKDKDIVNLAKQTIYNVFNRF